MTNEIGAVGKLVRDRIPAIIRANGDEPVVYRAEADEYRWRLRENQLTKLDHETLYCWGAADSGGMDADRVLIGL